MPEKEKTAVPRLRFPEFRDAGPWQVKRLGNICEINNGSSNAQDHVDAGEYPLFDRSLTVKRSNTYLFDCEAVIIPGEGSEFPPRYYKGKFDLHQRAYALTQFNAEGKFVFFLMDRLKAQLAEQAVKSTVLSLRMPILENFRITIPSKSEQQKIADCLSSLDDLIRAEAARLEALQAHKKGLMQQLFPREGETTPRLRFPEFRDAGPWAIKKIDDYFDVRSSKRVLQKDWQEEGVPFYRTRELVSLSKNEPFSSEVYISEELFSELANKYGLPVEGDFLVSGVGTLGIAYQVKAGDRFYFKDGNVLWLRRKSNINSTFFLYSFGTPFVQKQIKGNASISTVGTYTIEKARKTNFACPPTKEDQQKIADCLASLHVLIRAQGEKIDALKQHKKGLMQQLFPQEIGI